LSKQTEVVLEQWLMRVITLCAGSVPCGAAEQLVRLADLEAPMSRRFHDPMIREKKKNLVSMGR